MPGAGEYQLTGDFDSDLNRFILIEDMEEEERIDKEFEQMIIQDFKLPLLMNYMLIVE